MADLSLDLASRIGPRLHEPFLERAAEPGNRQRAQALGAFLTLRAVDRIADAPGGKSDAVKYQLRAAATYLDELHPHTQEISHLREIVRVASSAAPMGTCRRVWPPLLAYAYWLEQHVRLAEALDVLETSLRLGDAGALEERTATQLQRGRVLRMSGGFSDAMAAYAMAGEMANLSGDSRSEMVSRIGRAEVLQKTGDLPRSERELRTVLAAAQERGDEFIEARACHGLAVSVYLMKRPAEAACLTFRAFQLYEEPVQKARAMGDVGTFLKELGHYTAAREAFLAVLDSGRFPEIWANTVLELLELAALVQDRVGFARWRNELDANCQTLPPHERVDYGIKLGVGLASFGNASEAEYHLVRALAAAEANRLGPQIFTAEEALTEVRARRTQVAVAPVEPEPVEPELRSAIEGLMALREATQQPGPFVPSSQT